MKLTIEVPDDLMLASLEETKRGWSAAVRLRRGYPASALAAAIETTPQAAIDRASARLRAHQTAVAVNTPNKYEGLALKVNL